MNNTPSQVEPLRGMKLASVITRLNVGGAAPHVIALTAFLKTRGVETLLITGQPEPREGEMVELAHQKGCVPLRIPSLRNSATPVGDALTLLRLIRLFRRERPTIVHLHLLKARVLGGLAARIARVPIVVETFHGTQFVGYYPPPVTRLLIVLERLLGRWMDAVVAVSDAVATELIRLKIAPVAKVHVILLGLELDGFQTGSGSGGGLRAELHLPAQAPLVGAVGRIAPIKGIEYFIEAARQIVQVIPDARFVLIGDGPQRQMLERKVTDARIGDKVWFLGWRKDVVQILPDLDVVVLPSLHEGTPVSLIEAMAASRAVVATQVGGVPDVVEHDRTGLLIPPRDSRAIARAVILLLQDSERRHELGAAARRSVVGRFSLDRLEAEMEHFYRGLLSARLSGATGTACGH